MTRIAVVTGSSKGIGLATVAALCQTQQSWIVYLTSRDEVAGHRAVESLQVRGLNPRYHTLDIASWESIRAFKSFLVSEHGGIDVLINNAAISFDDESMISFGDQARNIHNTNYFGFLNFCYEMFPLLRDHGRVVNVSSLAGHRAYAKFSSEIQNAYKECTSFDRLNSLVERFLSLADRNDHVVNGWASSAYGTSKIAVTIASYLQHKLLLPNMCKKDLLLNVCDPGYVCTSMTKFKGTKSPEEGCAIIVYLATLPPNCTEPNGHFVCEDQSHSDILLFSNLSTK